MLLLIVILSCHQTWLGSPNIPSAERGIVYALSTSEADAGDMLVLATCTSNITIYSSVLQLIEVLLEPHATLISNIVTPPSSSLSLSLSIDKHTTYIQTYTTHLTIDPIHQTNHVSHAGPEAPTATAPRRRSRVSNESSPPSLIRHIRSSVHVKKKTRLIQPNLFLQSRSDRPNQRPLPRPSRLQSHHPRRSLPGR
jgi:hypothetical protein